MTTLEFQKLFESLKQFPGLQRMDWEVNQSGVDRGIEAVLIQRCTRELATYALVRLRLAAMPALAREGSEGVFAAGQLNGLVAWGRTQGSGSSALANIVEREAKSAPYSNRLIAAIASLQFYHCRDAPNPPLKSLRIEQGLEAIAQIDADTLGQSPTAGKFWQGKFETAKRLVTHVRQQDWSGVSDVELLQSLNSIAGVGEQTASMVALFWLGRPVPIIDMYLMRLLRNRNLPKSTRWTAETQSRLRRELLDGAQAIQSTAADWPASRVLSCLYLWGCELGRISATLAY